MTKNNIIPRIVFVSFIVFLVAVIYATYQDYGLTWDENWYAQQGIYYIVSIYNLLGISHNLVVADLSTFNPLFQLALTTRGVLFDTIVMWLISLVNGFDINTIHLTRALFSILIFAFTGLAASRLLGRWFGFIAMVFLFLYPSFYGHIFNNAPDMPAVIFLSILIWYFTTFLKSKGTLRQQIFLGLILALSATQRLVLLYLIPVVLLVLILYKMKKKSAFSNIAKKITTILFAALFFMHLTHPYLFTHPLLGIRDMITDAANFSGFPHPILFEGQDFLGEQLPVYYLPKTIAITTPLTTLILFIVGTVYMLRSVSRSKTELSDKYLGLFLLLVVFTPLLLVFLKKPVLYDSWRHFLFLSVPIVIIAVFGMKALWDIAVKTRALKILFIILVSLGLMSTAREMLLLHPYQYVYYNSLVGGLKGAYTNYETDYWGMAYKEAIDWFNENINDGTTQYKLLTEGNAQSSTLYFKDNMTYTTDMREADYFVSFTRWNRHLRNTGPTVYTVERKGVPLILIRKVEDGKDTLAP